MSGRRYIYALWCPLSEQYRYVGMTNNPETRFKYHASGGDPGDKRSWIDALKRRGLSPTMAVLEEVPTSEAYKVEGEWMRRMLERGHGLTNATRPGLPRTIKPSFSCLMDDEVSYALDDMAAQMALTPSQIVEKAVRQFAALQPHQREGSK